MNRGSTPGSDGLPLEFYIIFWHQIKVPFLECIKYSEEVGLLSSSERLGVISLFHKGKDLSRESLDNWRPITLTNTDYKIIAKVFSLRLDLVIDKLIGSQQVGFMKGRQISEILRIIDDLLDSQRIANKNGTLLAIDFKQAFDAINIPCIIKSLQIFGFGPRFTKWIETLNSERLTCVKNGGYISEKFEMNNGVRQGCPISPQLFILAVELLAQKILQDNSIIGIKPHLNSDAIKVCQYADDTSLFLHDLNDLQLAIAHLNYFSICSDLHINFSKSFALSTNATPINTGNVPILFKNSRDLFQ